MATLHMRSTGLPMLLFLPVWSCGMRDAGMAQPRAGANVTPPTHHSHLLFGNPSNATANPSDADNFLLEKPQFVLSYNNTNGTPKSLSH